MGLSSGVRGEAEGGICTTEPVLYFDGLVDYWSYSIPLEMEWIQSVLHQAIDFVVEVWAWYLGAKSMYAKWLCQHAYK